MEHRAHASTIILSLTHTLNLWVGLKGSECGLAAYQIKGKELCTNIEANTSIRGWRNGIYVL